MLTLNHQWLVSFLENGQTLTPESIQSILIRHGLETEIVSQILDHKVVVGHVVSVEPHPNATKLNRCRVDVGHGEPLCIICGCATVRAGIKVAVACLGAELPGLTIVSRQIRGEPSEGMLCSLSELGLTGSKQSGIWHLSSDAPVGKPIIQWLDLHAVQYVIEITPNRGDCLSVLGIARVIAADTGLALIDTCAGEGVFSQSNTISLAVEVKSPACGVFNLAKLVDLNPQATTPDWIKVRLQSNGIPLHGIVVDVLNYVMIETGQPMHAYDASKTGAHFSVRMLDKTQSLVLINQDRVSVDTQSLGIFSDDKLVGIAGYMGSLETSCTPETRQIYIESACFNPEQLAYHCRRYRKHSLAGMRYERGVDDKLASKALERAMALLTEYGDMSVHACVGHNCPRDMPTCQLDRHLIQRRLGNAPDYHDCVQAWVSSGCMVSEHDEYWEIVPPSWRYDLVLPEAYLSEILRYHPVQLLDDYHFKITVGNKLGHQQQNMLLLYDRLRNHLSDLGYTETVSLSLIADQANALFMGPHSQALTLKNPLTELMSVFRASLFPGLLSQLKRNSDHGKADIRLFEVGRVCYLEGDKQSNKEENRLSLVITGDDYVPNWMTQSKIDFFTAKTLASQVLDALGVFSAELTWSSSIETGYLHPYQSGAFVSSGKNMVTIGSLHPELASQYHIQQDVVLVDFDLDMLLPILMGRTSYNPVSKFPSVRRDLSLVVPDCYDYADIKPIVMEENSNNCLKNVFVFDIYTGGQLSKGFYAMGLGMVFQSLKHTLVETDINQSLARLELRLEQDLGIEIRGKT